jgi:hypothetical protein
LLFIAWPARVDLKESHLRCRRHGTTIGDVSIAFDSELHAETSRLPAVLTWAEPWDLETSMYMTDKIRVARGEAVACADYGNEAAAPQLPDASAG